MQIADTTIDNFVNMSSESVSVLFVREMCVCGASATIEQKETGIGGRWFFKAEEQDRGVRCKKSPFTIETATQEESKKGGLMRGEMFSYSSKATHTTHVTLLKSPTASYLPNMVLGFVCVCVCV